MVSPEQIFADFRKANDIKLIPIFGKGKVYIFQDKEFSEQELKGTAEYVGFTDGRCDNPSKYARGPKGTVQVDNSLNVNIGDILSGFEKASDGAISEDMKDMIDQMKQEFPEARYLSQYELGKSCR